MYRFSTFCLAVIMLSVTPARAQFKKGMRMPGITIGSAFFNSGKTEYSAPAPTNGYTSNTNSAGINLSPSLGWFISDKTVVGVRITGGYKYEKYIDADNNITFRKKENKSFTTGLGGFARNYFAVSGRLLPFVQVNADAGIGSSKTDGFNYLPTYKETYSGKSSGDFFANAGVAAGVTKMLNTHVGVDLYFGYTYSYYKNSFKTNTARDVGNDGSIDENAVSDITSKITNHGLAIGIGLQVFLEKR